MQYAEVFDWKRRRTLFLTYYTAGDTRNRGMALLAFSDMYRAAGVIPPARELPDHLAVLLEFAATVDEARRLRATPQTPHADRHAARRAAAGLADLRRGHRGRVGDPATGHGGGPQGGPPARHAGPARRVGRPGTVRAAPSDVRERGVHG